MGLGVWGYEHQVGEVVSEHESAAVAEAVAQYLAEGHQAVEVAPLEDQHAAE